MLETAPRTTLPSPGELPGWRDLGCAAPSELRCSQRVTTMLNRPEVHAVQGTRDFSHSCSGRMCNNPRWHTAEAWHHDSQQPLKFLQMNRAALPEMGREREDKMAAARSHERRALISMESKHIPRYVMDWLGARMLFCMLTHSPRDYKWRKQRVYVAN